MRLIDILIPMGSFFVIINSTFPMISQETLICGCKNFHFKNRHIEDRNTTPNSRRLNLVNSPTNTKQFIDKNGQGGYTFYFDSTVPSKAKLAFKRAVKSWVKATGINWSVSDYSGDSLISFKKLSGALGLTYSEWMNFPNEPSCITNLSIEFSSESNWYFGENPRRIKYREYDFETVALHELGHCFQLNHVSKPSEIMFPSIRNGVTRREITPDALRDAMTVKDDSVLLSSLIYNSMRWLDLNKVDKVIKKSVIFTVNENEIFVLHLDSDKDGYLPFIYELSGPDSDFFQFNSSTGELAFKKNPDFEQPLDQNKDNNYEISITATSWFSQETEDIDVQVIDIKETSLEDDVVKLPFLQKWNDDSWLGTFYFHKSNWIYHLELGWSYLSIQPNDWVWLWSPNLHWITTSAKIYPYAFMQKENNWIKLNSYKNEKLYYSFLDKTWKKIILLKN